MESWFEIKLRAILGGDVGDDLEVVILGRKLRWTKDGLRYEADPKHRKMILDYFGFEGKSNGIIYNGEKDIKEEEDSKLLALKFSSCVLYFKRKNRKKRNRV